MNKKDKGELYNTAWTHWGSSMQLDMLIEEMAELTQSILKARRNTSTFSHGMFGEIADVLVCLEQVETRLKMRPRPCNAIVGDNGNDWDTVLDIKEEKLARLKERLVWSMKRKTPVEE